LHSWHFQKSFNLLAVGALFLSLHADAQRYGYRPGQEYRSLNTDSYEIAIQKNGRLDVAHASGDAIFLDAYPMVWIEGENKPERFKLDGRFSQRHGVNDRLGQGQGMLIKFKSVEWTLNAYPSKPYMAVQVAYVNNTKKPVKIKALYPWVVGGKKNSGLTLGVQSQQSRLVPDPLVSIQTVQGEPLQTKNCIGIYNPRTGRSMITGFVSQNSAINSLYVQPVHPKDPNIIPDFHAMNTYDPPVLLEPGERLESEILYIALTEQTPLLAMQRYGKAVSIVNNFSRKDAAPLDGVPIDSNITDPFFLPTTSTIVEQHPDWFASHTSRDDIAILDVTHPDASDYLYEWVASSRSPSGRAIARITPSALLHAQSLHFSEFTNVEAVQLARSIIYSTPNENIFWVEPLSVNYVIPNRGGLDNAVYASVSEDRPYRDLFWQSHYLKNSYGRDITLVGNINKSDTNSSFFLDTIHMNSFATANDPSLNGDLRSISVLSDSPTTSDLLESRKIHTVLSPADWFYSDQTQILFDTSTNPPGEWLKIHLINPYPEENQLNISLPAMGARENLNYTIYDDTKKKYLGLVRNRFQVNIGPQKTRTFILKVYQSRPMVLGDFDVLEKLTQNVLIGSWDRKKRQLSGSMLPHIGWVDQIDILFPKEITPDSVFINKKRAAGKSNEQVFSFRVIPKRKNSALEWMVQFSPAP
jgi:hypothetical protein